MKITKRMNLFKKFRKLRKDWKDFKKYRHIDCPQNKNTSEFNSISRYYIQEIKGSFTIDSDTPSYRIDQLRFEQKSLFRTKATEFIQETTENLGRDYTRYTFSLFVGVPR